MGVDRRAGDGVCSVGGILISEPLVGEHLFVPEMFVDFSGRDRAPAGLVGSPVALMRCRAEFEH